MTDAGWVHDPSAADNEFLSGWAPSPHDPRDHRYEPPADALAADRPDVDLNPGDWPVWAQGALPSCTAQALAGAMSLLLRSHRKPGAAHTHDWEPSRMFLYYNERAEEGKEFLQAPAYMRDAIKSVRKTGICPNELWPYEPLKWAEKPSAAAYEAALPHKEIAYSRIDADLAHLKACLKEGHPFTIGFRLFQSLLDTSIETSGNIPAPTAAQLENLPHSGHCVLAIGYDDDHERFLIRNSFGATWGQDGYGTLPYDFVTVPKLCADLWTVRWAGEAPAASA